MKTLTTEQIELARQLIGTGVTQVVVASMMKVSRKVLRRELGDVKSSLAEGIAE